MGLKSRLIDAAFRCGFFSPLAKLKRGRGAILMFHEVHSDPLKAAFYGCTTLQLDMILKALRSWDIDLIGAHELLPRLQSDNPRQFVLITFDDGYRDNLYNALPILQKYNAPALINVPTGAVTRDLYCWWLALRDLFMTRDELRVGAQEGRHIVLSSAEKRLSEYAAVNGWLAEDFTRAFQLKELFEDEGVDFSGLCEEAFLDEAGLKQLAADPLITIGAHTVTHRSLAALSETEVHEELLCNKQYLEGLLDTPVQHLAYPFGGAGQCGIREAKSAKDIGFDIAIAVRPGILKTTDLEDPFLLARSDAGYLGITERQLYFMINGLYSS
mgnify:CR=1 FL=1